MTSTGQGLGANPLLGSAELPSVSSSNGLTKATPGSLSESSNVLKSNDFSNVLKKHWAVGDERQGRVVSAPGGLTTADSAVLASGSFSFRDMEFSGKFSTGIAAEGGNALPVGSDAGLATVDGNTQAVSANPNVGSQLVTEDATNSGLVTGQGEGDFTSSDSGLQQTASGRKQEQDGLLAENGLPTGDEVLVSSDSVANKNSVSGLGEAVSTADISGDSATGNGYFANGVAGNPGSRTDEVLNGSQQPGNTRQNTGEPMGLAAGQAESAATFTAASNLQTGGRGTAVPNGLPESAYIPQGQTVSTADNATLTVSAAQNPNALFASQLQSLNGKPLFQGVIEGKGLTKAAKFGAEQLAALSSQALPSQSGDSAAVPGSASTLSHSYTTTETPTLHTAIPVPVGKPGWNETVMQRVMWMSSQQINKAEIALDPPELGPLNVKISSQGEHTSVMFTSTHGAVRDALDQGLPRLREMLENQGLNLADVDVSDHSASQQQAQDEGDSFNGEAEGRRAGAVGAPEEVESDSISKQSAVASTLSLVDQYV